MKTNKNKIAVLFACLTLFFSSCSDDDDVVVQPDNTITGIASRTADLSILVQALTRADLATTLQGAGPFTVFAPRNAAFNSFLTANGFVTNGAPDINTVPIPALREVLLNHVISGEFESTDLVNNTYIKTLGKGSASATNTLSMYVNTTSGVRLNGVSSVITTTPGATFDILASNGVVHVVDAVIGLPTIVTHVQANPAFDTLEVVVTSTSGAFGNQGAVLNALSTNTTPLTLFAPNNAAFTAATTGSGFAVGANATQVSTVLLYHATGALGGNILSSALSNSLGNIPMATSPIQNTTVNITGGAKIIDQAGNNCNILVPSAVDIQCANGVIHGIDRVLQPVL